MTDNLNSTLTSRQKAITITGIALAVIIPVLLSILFTRIGLASQDRIFYSRFIFWVELLFIGLYAYRLEKQKFLIWTEQKQDAGFFIISVVVLYLLSIPDGILSNIPRLFGLSENNDALKRLMPIFFQHQWLLVFTAFTAGVTEELLFRGYVLTRLARLFKDQVSPIIISALLFSALHYSYKSLRELIFAFVIGLIYGYYYQKYRNIVVLIIAHFLLDLINLEISIHFTKMIK